MALSRYPWDPANGMKGWASQCVLFAKEYADRIPSMIYIHDVADFRVFFAGG